MRRAAPADAPKIFNLVRKHITKYASGLPKVDDNDCMMWIIHTICNGTVMLAEVGERIVGTFGGVAAFHGWNRKIPYLRCEWMCVLDQYTDTDIPKAMIAKIKRDANITENNIIFPAYGEQARFTDTLLLIDGMEKFGESYIWRGKRESEAVAWVKE